MMGTTMTRLAGVAAALAFGAVPMAAQTTPGIRIRSIFHARSAPLRSYPPAKGWRPGTPPRVIPWRQPRAKGGKHGGGPGGGGGGNWSDADVQGTYATQHIQLGAAFPGIGFTGAIPPDENLAVGKDPSGNTQIVQIVNTSYEVYDSSGTPLAGNDLGASIFSALPSTSLCAQVDGGDPIALFDQLHGNHWLISQLAYNSDFSQNDLCLAISVNSDATGNYEVYDIPFGNQLPDYPKLAVWSDGIYFSANMFRMKVSRITGAVSSTFVGAQACGFPSSDVTTAPSSVQFTCSGTGNTGIYNILPADVDGPTTAAPPTTTGDYYLQFLDNLNSTSGNILRLYQLNSGSLVTLGDLTVNTFHEACGGGTCVPQLGTTQLLDSLGDRLMYRLSYRNYGTSQQMVVNQSVQVNSSSQQTGVRWYQLCNQSGSIPFYVCHESTFSPDSTTYRWMGSIAQNKWGDIGLGYSTSSSSMYPSIAVTGMSTNQNGGTADNGMETEQQMFEGQGYQDTYSRWGDYSGIAVDPTDDCTFWYTNEYLTTPNGFIDIIWGTAIGSFTFPNCR